MLEEIQVPQHCAGPEESELSPGLKGMHVGLCCVNAELLLVRAGQ